MKDKKLEANRICINRIRTSYSTLDKRKYNAEYIHYVLKTINRRCGIPLQFLLVNLLECGLAHSEEFSKFYIELREEYENLTK